MEFLLFIFIGILIGAITGLIPGIHPNLIILTIPILITIDISLINILGFIVALGVTNSIIDFIPSILLGAPEAGNEMSVLPGHKMIMEGYGYDAIKLTAIGSLASIIFSILSIPFLIHLIPNIYTIIQPYIGYLLLIASFLMIATEKRIVPGLLVFILAGVFGLMLDQIPINSALLLFPIFSGMFGVSMLIMQIKNKTKLPDQNSENLDIVNKDVYKGSLLGTIGGFVSGLLPGLGISQIASFLSVEKNNHRFLSSIGAITTSNILISILSLILISRSRSGLSVAIDSLVEITLSEFAFILSVALFSSAIAVIITLKLCKPMIKKIQQINYTVLSYSIIGLLFLLSYIFLGFLGILIITTSTAIGLIANLLNVKKGLLMAVLLIPTMIFYLT